MPKTQIAFVVPSLSSGGAERVVSNLANELSGTFGVHIITFANNDPFYELEENIKLFPCTESIQPSANLFQAIRLNFKLYKSLKKYVKKEKINLLVGFLVSANVLAILTAKSCRIPVIVSARNNPEMDQIGFFWNFLRKTTYKYANRIVVQTQVIKDYYQGISGNNPIDILPNPIAADLAAKRMEGTPKEDIILNVGRLSDQKAQDILIRAFSILPNKNWKLYIAGEGSNRKPYQQLIEELELEEKVFLLGRVPDIWQLYNSSKIFAFSSQYEGFPNALIEAMYFGMPCVSTDCPTGPSELIQDGVNGFLVPVNDPESMSKKLEILMNDEALSKTFRQKATESVKQFDIKAVAIQWKSIISKYVSQDPMEMASLNN